MFCTMIYGSVLCLLKDNTRARVLVTGLKLDRIYTYDGPQHKCFNILAALSCQCFWQAQRTGSLRANMIPIQHAMSMLNMALLP